MVFELLGRLKGPNKGETHEMMSYEKLRIRLIDVPRQKGAFIEKHNSIALWFWNTALSRPGKGLNKLKSH